MTQSDKGHSSEAPSRQGNRLAKRQKRMKVAVKYLAHYMATYKDQDGYLDYLDDTLIMDVLYGLGVALGEEYKYGTGFSKFQEFLLGKLGAKRMLQRTVK